MLDESSWSFYYKYASRAGTGCPDEASLLKRRIGIRGSRRQPQAHRKFPESRRFL
nr:MAG TPA: hypothetical protein [Caudoviricetes sp.]